MKLTGFLEKNISRLFIVAAAVFLLTTCDNLLQIGMGSEVDLEPPSSTLVSPAPGSFISGSITFKGSVTDDINVSKAEISVDKGQTWTDVVFDQSSWSYGYSTVGNSDGRLSVILRVTDSADKVTTSEEYLFSVDNTPPVVLITSPRNYTQLSFNTSATMTVAAADVYQLVNFRVNASAATIPDVFDTSTDDPDTLTWGAVSGYPKQINQSASPLSYEFNSLQYTTDIGEPHRYFRFGFGAEDEAGNVSTKFFHIDDVAAINDNQLLTVDQIAAILNGNNYTNSFGTLITAADLKAIQRSVTAEPILLEFDEDTDLPWAKLSFPASDTAALPTMRSSDTLQGYFDDDDGIDPDTMLILIEKAVGYDPDTGIADSWETAQDWIQPDSFELTSDTRIDWEHPVIDYGQGVFRLTLDVHDINGTDRQSGDYSRIYMVSDGAADLEITPPANLNFNNSIVLTGTASHSIAITSVLLNIGYGPTSGPTWVFSDIPAVYDEGTSGWTFNTDDVDFAAMTPAGGLDNLSEGEILVRAVANGETEKSIFLYKDVTAPTVSFDRPEENSQMNVEAVVSGAADDALSGISNIEVLIKHPDDADYADLPEDSPNWQPYSAAVTLGVEGYEFGPSLVSWRYTFDTTAYLDNVITFYLRGTDRAGNSTIASRDFEIFQDSDLPVISLSNVNVAGSYFDNVLAGEPHLLGAILDDDQVDPDTFRYRVKRLDSSWGPWVYPYAPGEKAATTRLDFNIAIYEPDTVATPISEGSRDLQLWVEDVNGLGISRTAAESGGALDLAFSVDGNPPTISLTGPASGSLKSGDFIITGNVGDGFGIDLVQLSFDGGATYPETLYTYDGVSDPDTAYAINYPVTVGGTGLADGTYNLRVRAQDLSGSSASENSSVTVDTTAPSISISQPLSLDEVNDAVTISGTITEALQMDSSWYWIGTEGAPAPDYESADPDPAATGWTEFDDPRNPSVVWDSYAAQAAQAVPFASQNYTIHIIARDVAGNWNLLETETPAIIAPVTRTVTADQESDRPEIVFTNIDAAGTGLPAIYGSAPDNLFGSNAVLSGTVSDDDGIAGTDVLISTRSYDWGTASWNSWSSWATVSSPFSDTRTSGTWSDAVSGLGEGVHQVMIRVLDKDFVGTLADSDTTATWPELFKWNQSAAAEFAIDTDLPAANITSPAAGAYLNDSFTISGNATDNNVVNQVLISTDGGTTYTAADLSASGEGTPSVLWTWDGLSGISEGSFTFKVKAIDVFGKESVSDLKVTVDRTAPDMSIIVPESDSTINGSLVFSGKAVEGSEMVSVDIALDDNNSLDTDGNFTDSIYDIDWFSVDLDYKDWSWSVDTTTLQDGNTYTLYVRGYDAAGNVSSAGEIALRSFTVVQASDKPSINLSTLSAAGLAQDNLLPGSMQMFGTVTDDDSVDRTSIQIRIDANNDGDFSDGGLEDWADITGQPSSNGNVVAWSHTFSGLTDGQYRFEMQAYDVNFDSLAAGALDVDGSYSDTSYNTISEGPVAFSIDTALPEGSVTSPARGAYLKDPGDGTITISGTASDASGIQSVEIAIDGGVAIAVTSTTPAVPTATTPVSWSSDYTITTDKQVSYQIIITDNYDKIYTIDSYFTVDTVAPVPSYLQPASEDTVNGSLLVRGATDEANLISGVYFWIGEDGGGSPAVPAVPADITVSADWVANGWTALDGKFSWSQRINTTLYNEVLHDVYVYAVDNAGNLSAPAILDNLDFDQSTDLPVITVNNLAVNPAVNLFGTTGIISGNIIDDDAVDASTIQISFNDGVSWQNVTSQGANGTSVNWSHDLNDAGAVQPESPTAYNVRIKASDVGDLANGIPVQTSEIPAAAEDPYLVAVDRALPTVAVSSIEYADRYGGPDIILTGAALDDVSANNNFTITGTASDATGIVEVAISLDGGTTWLTHDESAVDSFTFDGSTWSYEELVGADNGATDGTKDYDIRVTDAWGKTATESLSVFVDTIAPVIDFTIPAEITLTEAEDAPNVNGDVLVRGTIDESNTVSALTVIGGISTGPTVDLGYSGNTISWQTTIADSGNYANTDYAINKGANIWRFPLEVTATDDSGNRTIETGYLDLDPDSDKPVVSIVSPADSASVSGTFLVNGTILDDDGTDHVDLQLDLDDDGFFDDAGDSLPGALLSISNDLNGNSVADDTVDESTPIELAAPSGSWSILLNASDFSIVNLANAGYTNSTGYIRMLFTPYDMYGLAGDAETVRIYLDTNSPIISGLDETGLIEQEEPTPDSGTTQKGSITVRARFEDDKELLYSGMRISFDGGASFEQITSQAGYSITDETVYPALPDLPSAYEYYVAIPVDTTTAIAGGNGVLSVQLSVTDQTNKQSTKSLRYNIDNDLPTVSWNENGSGTLLELPFIGTPPDEIYTYKGPGSPVEPDDAYKVLGAAVDTGTISGIEKVNMYFVKNVSGTDYFYKPTLEDGSDPDAERLAVDTNTRSVWDGDSTYSSIPFIDASNYVITIDNRIEQGIFDQTVDIGDFDGYQESLKSKEGYDEWYAYFDTAQLPDGPLKIYSVVYDEAGNISYTVTDAQIANNPPAIPTILVGGTTIDDSNDMAKATGSIQFTINTEDAENIDVSTITMDIVARYIVDSGMGAEDAVFDPASYSYTSFAYNDFDTKPAGDAVSAQFIKTFISDNGTEGDASDDPLASNYYYEYLVQVNDSDGNLVTRTFYLWINNEDDAAPTVTIDEFSQDSVSGGAGHVEEAANSLNDAAGEEDADISGTVTVSGTAFDLTQVSSVTLEYSADAGSSWYTAGTVSPGSGLSAGVGNDIDGYDYTWSIDWDTSSLMKFVDPLDVNIIAGEDILLRAYATDGTNVTPETGAGARPVMPADVVPYITEIQTGLDNTSLKPARRSVMGWYPVRVGQQITVNGYNLPADYSSSVMTIGGVDVPAGSVSGTSDSLTVDLGILNSSGELVVTTNNVSSINHENNNLLAQNQEDNDYNDSLDDNRYLAFFNPAAAAFDGIDAVMRADKPGGQRDGTFDWYYIKNNVDVFYNANKLAYSFKVNDGDFTINDSGTPVYLFLNDSNSVDTITDQQYYFYGSVLWGLGDTAYGGAATGYYAMNWNVDIYPTLGVGNLSFNTGTNYTSATYTATAQMSRYENLRILTSGDDADMTNYVFYFDNNSSTRGIVTFSYHTGTTAAIGRDMGDYGGVPWYTELDENNNQDTEFKYNNGGNDTGIETPEGRVNLTSGANDSNQFSVAMDGSGRIHLVFWNESDNKLYYMYNDSPYLDPNTGDLAVPATGTAAGWSTPRIVRDLDDPSNPDGGQYPDIVVDDSDQIHIVYQDSENNTLKYAFLTSRTDTDADVYHVDGLFGVGSYNSISLKEDFDLDGDGLYTGDGESSGVQRPVISSFAGGLSTTNYGVKLAYPLADPGLITDGFDPVAFAYTGDWEVIVVPAGSRPDAAQTFAETNGAWVDASNTGYGQGDIVIGYNAATLEYSTFLGF